MADNNEEDSVAISMKNGDHPRSTWEKRAPDLLKGWGGDRWNCRRKLFRTIHELFRYRDELKISPNTKEAEFDAVTNVISYYQYVIDVNDGNGKHPIKTKGLHTSSELFAVEEMEKAAKRLKVLGKPRMGITGGGKLSSHGHHHAKDHDDDAKDERKETAENDLGKSESTNESETGATGKGKGKKKCSPQKEDAGSNDAKETNEDETGTKTGRGGSQSSKNTEVQSIQSAGKGKRKSQKSSQKDELGSKDALEKNEDEKDSSTKRDITTSQNETDAKDEKETNDGKDAVPPESEELKEDKVKNGEKVTSTPAHVGMKSKSPKNSKAKSPEKASPRKRENSNNDEVKSKSDEEKESAKTTPNKTPSSKKSVAKSPAKGSKGTTKQQSTKKKESSSESKSEPKKEKTIDEMDEEEFFYYQHNSHCEVCSDGGNLLCCSTCNLVFHQECARPTLFTEPPDNWSCAYCHASGLTGWKYDSRERQRNIRAVREMEKLQHAIQKKLDEEKKGAHSDDDEKEFEPGSEPESEGENDEEKDQQQETRTEGKKSRKKRQSPSLIDSLSPDADLYSQGRPNRPRKQPELYDGLINPQEDPSTKKRTAMRKRMQKAREARMAKINGRKRKARHLDQEEQQQVKVKARKVEVKKEQAAKKETIPPKREVSCLLDSLSPDVYAEEIQGQTRRSRKQATHFGSKSEMDPLQLEMMAVKESKAETRRRRRKRQQQRQRQNQRPINDEDGERQTQVKEHEEKESIEKESTEKEQVKEEWQEKEQDEHNSPPEAPSHRDPIPREIETSDIMEAQSERSMNQPTFSESSPPVAITSLSKRLTTATTRQICEWLVKRGVSNATLEVLWREEIDGTFLFEETLDEVKSALKDEGVKLGQISKIRKAIKEAIKEGALF